MKILFPIIFIIVASLLAAISVDLYTGRHVITYLENMGEGFATFIVGVLGFGGLALVAWYNSYSDRLARQEERDASIKGNADRIFISLVELNCAFYAIIKGLQTATFDETDTFEVGCEIIEFWIEYPIDALAAEHQDVIADNSLSKGLGEEITFRLNSIQPIADVKKWHKTQIEFLERHHKNERSIIETLESHRRILIMNTEAQKRNIEKILALLRSRFGYGELPGYENDTSDKYYIPF